MKSDNDIYSDEELEIIRQIENGNAVPLAKSEFESEKKRLQLMAMNIHYLLQPFCTS